MPYPFIISRFMKLLRKLSIVFFTFYFFSCQQNDRSQSSLAETSSYYTPQYAKNFTVEVSESDKISIQIFTKTDTLVYHLNTKDKNLAEKHFQLTTPIKKSIFFSTTHLTYLNAIDQLEVVLGFSNLDFIGVDSVREYLTQQNVTEIGEEFSLNNELLAALNPDAIFSSGFNSEKIITETPLIPILEWQEAHPLGRAEWIVVFGVLTGQFEESIALFKHIENQYKLLTHVVKDAQLVPPKVLVGFPYQGQWYAPGGHSFMSRFLEDASADYPWATIQQKGSVVVDLEEVYKVGIEAPFWIVSGRVSSLKEIQNTDERFTDFKAFQNLQVFNNDKIVNNSGWNEYFETSVLLPHEVLGDLIQIFHPSMLKERSLFYHRRLPK